MQGIQHDLPVPVRFIRQLHLGKGHRLLHPMGAEVRALRVYVNRIRRGDFCLAAWYPLPVNVLPSTKIILRYILFL